jgi:hypothetical protein
VWQVFLLVFFSTSAVSALDFRKIIAVRGFGVVLKPGYSLQMKKNDQALTPQQVRYASV